MSRADHQPVSALTSPSPGTATDAFRTDVIAGLSSATRSIPSKYFYDERGSRLFEEICELDEYYLTRTELAIMRRFVPEMAEALGEQVLLIEPGSGASIKVRLLLRHLRDAAGYVPVDISSDHLLRWAHLLQREHPGLPILPVHADFSQPFELPPAPAARRRAIYFPGSTIGNFTPADAVAWLARMAAVAGPRGALLIGVDLKKDAATLEAAYDDRRGVTRAFNLNLLERMRRELGAEIAVEQFEHRAVYNHVEGRIEMHLRSTEDQTIRIGATAVRLAAGETIHTENSYKYDRDQFRDLARSAGWERIDGWTDEDELFSVQCFERGE